MRSLLYQTLVDLYEADDEWSDAGVPRIYQAGTLGHNGIPAQPKKPFATIRMLPSSRFLEVRDTSAAERQTFQINAFDEIGSSYLRIDAFLRGCMAPIEALVGVRSSSGARCFEALWLGMSQDLPDEAYQAITKFATAQLSSS